MTAKKSMLPFLALIVLVAVLAVACGSTSPSNTTGPAVTTATTAGGTETTAGGTATTAGGGATTTAAGGAADGAAVFADFCTSCHGQDASGGAGPDLRHETDLAKVQNQVRNGGKRMPPFGSQLSDAQINAVAQYVMSLNGQ